MYFTICFQRTKNFVNNISSVCFTLLILMDLPIHTDTISMDLSILYFKVSRIKRCFFNIFLALKIVFILANSADPDKMSHYVAFHLGLH